MRLSFLLPAFIFYTSLSTAQPKGYTAVKDVQVVRNDIAKNNATAQTIASDFVQTKTMTLLKEKIRSKGKFYYKKEDKIRIEYTSPYNYLVVMNNGQMMVKDEQKTSKINTRNSKMMQSVNRIMVDCMKGDMFNNPDFKAQAFENANNYFLQLAPANEQMKKLFAGIEVTMLKKTSDVVSLVMNENGGDHTIMDFSNTLRNKALDESLFKVK